MTNIVEFLKKRRSVMVRNMTMPGPDANQVSTLLEIGARVPDHGKLVPWRFIVFEGDARYEFDNALAEIFKNENLEADENCVDTETNRFKRAPLVIGVVARSKEHPNIPVWEMDLSAGAVCQNILIAAQSMGFAAQWLTEWYAYHDKVTALLGLAESEKMAGFIYIGSSLEAPTERGRPDIEEITSYWSAE